MKTTIQLLPGIKAIGWINCRFLPRRVDLTGICGMPLPILTEVHHLDFFGAADCQCLHKKEGAGYQDQVSLKFLSSEELPLDIPLGFVLTDLSDQSYLIGSLEPPRPTIERERRFGTANGDSAGTLYTVKHVALKTLIPCHIS